MDGFTREIPLYRSKVHVAALEIKQVIPNPRGFEIYFRDPRFTPMQVSAEWVRDNCPLPGGYMVLGNGLTFMHREFFDACFEPAGTSLKAAAPGGESTKH